jgi:putative lipoic acid-binding regulatory protein
MIDLNNQKVEIKYPCRWNYKAVGKDKFQLKREISEAILEHDFNISSSKASKTGKFISLNVDVHVISDEHRQNIYKKISSIECVLQVV